MQKIIPLEYGQYYHIYNCAINGEPIYRESDNYEYFLRLYHKYINPIAETYAWCLMGNHFHLLVRIKEVDEIIDVNYKTNKPPHLNFSHLFNAYSQAFNKKYARHGGLFKRPFKRKLIDNESYLKNVLLYIHNNPVHHGFCDHPVEYAWSSFLHDPANEISDWFGGKSEYEAAHNQYTDFEKIKYYLED